VRTIVLLVAVFLFVGPIVVVAVYRFVPPPMTFLMVQRMVEGRGFDRRWVPMRSISPTLVRAVIAAEDAHFCEHHGFDILAIQKAMRANERGRKLRGGSTISQQTAKNVFLWPSRDYVRKGLEAWFTVLIEKMWGKRRIMEVYLNVAETGIGTYGVEAGAQRYYRHSAARLSRVEAARIAAALPSPKKREVVGATGFTRRHGNAIAARTGVVKRGEYDGCVYD
jgi:monofunctional biosynthetic peptidoglycan transglycosylase